MTKAILLFNNKFKSGMWYFLLNGVYVPKIYTSILLNTKYLKLMMQIEDYQPLNQDYYLCVCVCDDYPDYKKKILLNLLTQQQLMCHHKSNHWAAWPDYFAWGPQGKSLLLGHFWRPQHPTCCALCMYPVAY